jgi:hypothetical protein
MHLLVPDTTRCMRNVNARCQVPFVDAWHPGVTSGALSLVSDSLTNAAAAPS